MPGHIRSIKPELLDLECAAELSSDAWRVWVSLFVLADDRGNLRASPRLLAAHIFHDTAKTDVIEEALAALAQLPPRYRVTLYRHETELYAHLSGFTDQTSAIGQYEKKLAKGGRVPEPSSPGSTPERIISTAYATKKRRTEASSGGQRKIPPRARVICPYPCQVSLSLILSLTSSLLVQA